MTFRDRVRLATRCVRAAERHAEAGNTTRTLEAIAMARRFLDEATADDYAEGERDGRIVTVERGELLKELVADRVSAFDSERDVRVSDCIALERL